MDLPKIADVVVVGGGVMGASTAYHLAIKGCADVVLLERNSLFGQEATGKCAGGIRYQFATEINVRLSLISLPMLDRFEEELGQAIDLRRCGYLFLLTNEQDVAAFRANVALQHRLGVMTEWLTGDEVRARLLLLRSDDVLAATWHPRDGLADPNGVVQGYISGARRLGAKCLAEVEVTGLRVEGGRVRAVQTRQGEIATPVVVNAAGPWAGQVGAMAGVEGFDQRVDHGWELVHFEAAMARMPLLAEVGIGSRWAGLYEVSPDAHPILGKVPEVEGFYCIAGFSGHGFMHGPVCGLLLAEEILDGQAHTLDISSLRLSRFREGKPIVEYNVV
ncbi:MAG: FAD-binding oxidoreductase [Chloroflexi bacterium]|nr:FAD-binding oxidoreductase [Chloroflexota bacterium]